MIRTAILCTAFLVLTVGGSFAQQDGDRLGEVRKIDKASGEILVSLPASRNDIKVGDLLYAKVKDEYVVLRATFPMQTVVKCRAEGKNRALLTAPGAPVFRTMKTAPTETADGSKAAAAPAKGAYEPGAKGPAGGYVFYDKGSYSDGWRYLEAASEDITLTAPWFNGENVEIGAVGTEIGTGRENTKKIIAAQGGGNYAAKLCADYRGGGKSDWFLPSKNELVLLRKALPGGRECGLSGKYYWSSSEVDGSLAWRVGENGADQFADGKDCTACVRAIRVF